MKPLLILFAAGLMSPMNADCTPVSGGKILASDLAAADPEFAQLPASLVVGFAPSPGARRVYATAELERIARSNGLSLKSTADICFEVPMHQISEAEAVAAMRRQIPGDAELRVLELSRSEVPVGELDFPLSGLEPPVPGSDGVQLWRAGVRYAETRRAPFWARVSITVRITGVVATKDLPANTPIDASGINLQTRSGPLDRELPALRIEDVVGRIPRRAVKAGSFVPLAVLSMPPSVRRGDTVRVEVNSGSARLHFDAIVEAAACAGDLVELRNPLSGKTFKARLGDAAKAFLVVGKTL